MKGKNAIAMVALITISVIIGCAKVPTVKVPAVKEAPLAEIIVFKGEAPLSESRHNETLGEYMGLGGSLILTAQGIDANGKRVKISPTWTADPDVFQITPPVGPTVTVKSVAQKAVYATKIIIEADGVKKEFLMSTY